MDIVKGLVTVVIPARNEPYLKKTIEGLLSQSSGSIEVIINLDGYWPPAGDIIDDPRVIYIHRGEAKGMRGGINSCVAIARGEYIMKTDAHCDYQKGWDEELKKSCKEHYVVVPRRYPLDPDKWEIEERTDDKYPIDYEYIDPSDLHGVIWKERREERINLPIDEIISAQGSCWFTTKEHFEFMDGLDEEAYGTFFLEFQEISFKTWLSGGKVVVNKNTSYKHWHKTDGRGYNLDKGEREKAQEFMQRWIDGTAWSKQTLPFSSMIDRFMPMPGWENYEKNRN
jgi:glycosyltransferase involved in cell wall biosynthesis